MPIGLCDGYPGNPRGLFRAFERVEVNSEVLGDGVSYRADINDARFSDRE